MRHSETKRPSPPVEPGRGPFFVRSMPIAPDHFDSASAFSTASVTFGDSGFSPGSNRAITSPLRLTRNLAKFQLMSPANLGSVSLLVRYW